MNGEYAALANRIRTRLHDLERVVNRSTYLLEQAKMKSDDGYLDGVALNLHGFYAGAEGIFEDIGHTVEGSVPKTSDWHKKLLLQMSGEIETVRPTVIQHSTRICLDEYRAFRHVVRNVYTFNLRPTRLEELTKDLQGCYSTFKQDLEEFINFLHEQTNADID